MIYTPLTKKAMFLMAKAHENQVDKAGMPYAFHPFHVAEQMTDEISTAVALLHDIIEDTPVTAENLLEAGFPPEVVDRVVLLTKPDGESYFDYIDRVSADPVASLVKIADLEHNCNISRLSHPTEADYMRVKKYERAKHMLMLSL